MTFLGGSSEASVCTWMKYTPASVTADGVLLAQYNNGTTGWLFWVDDSAAYNGATDTVSFAINPGGGSGGRVEGSTGLVTTGTWDHYCGVFKGASYIRLYKNGRLVGSTTTTDGVVSSLATNVYMGRSTDGRYLNAVLDDMRVYNYALTQAQVMQVANQGAAVRFGPSSGSP